MLSIRLIELFENIFRFVVVVVVIITKTETLLVFVTRKTKTKREMFFKNDTRASIRFIQMSYV